jgi:MinD superfamily P-loop ATPase
MNSPVKVRIVESLCIACGLCREVCPEHAVHPKMQDIHHMYEVVEAECTGCGDCLPYCPEPGALQQFNPPLSCGELCSPSVLNTVLK